MGWEVWYEVISCYGVGPLPLKHLADGIRTWKLTGVYPGIQANPCSLKALAAKAFLKLLEKQNPNGGPMDDRHIERKLRAHWPDVPDEVVDWILDGFPDVRAQVKVTQKHQHQSQMGQNSQQQGAAVVAADFNSGDESTRKRRFNPNDEDYVSDEHEPPLIRQRLIRQPDKNDYDSPHLDHYPHQQGQGPAGNTNTTPEGKEKIDKELNQDYQNQETNEFASDSEELKSEETRRVDSDCESSDREEDKPGRLVELDDEEAEDIIVEDEDEEEQEVEDDGEEHCPYKISMKRRRGREYIPAENREEWEGDFGVEVELYEGIHWSEGTGLDTKLFKELSESLSQFCGSKIEVLHCRKEKYGEGVSKSRNFLGIGSTVSRVINSGYKGGMHETYHRQKFTAPSPMEKHALHRATAALGLVGHHSVGKPGWMTIHTCSSA